MRRPIVCLIMLSALQSAQAQSATWTNLATVSGTLTPGSLCTTDGTDITCTQSLSGLQNPDHIASGTTAVTVNDAGTVSVTTNGAATAYFDAGGLTVANGYFTGKLGVGTVSPVAALEAKGNLNAAFEAFRMVNSNSGSGAHSIFRFFNNLGGTGAGFYFNSSARFIDVGPNGFGFYNDMGPVQFRAASNLVFQTGGAALSVIMKQGGTLGVTSWTLINAGMDATPSAPLDVSGTVSSTDIQLSRTGSAPAGKCATAKDEGRIIMTHDGPYVCLLR